MQCCQVERRGANGWFTRRSGGRCGWLRAHAPGTGSGLRWYRRGVLFARRSQSPPAAHAHGRGHTVLAAQDGACMVPTAGKRVAPDAGKALNILSQHVPASGTTGHTPGQNTSDGAICHCRRQRRRSPVCRRQGTPRAMHMSDGKHRVRPHRRRSKCSISCTTARRHPREPARCIVEGRLVVIAVRPADGSPMPHQPASP